jgi:hypothetical protein
MATTTIRPDSRGRLALGPLIDAEATYQAEVDEHGTITLAPIAAILTPEQLADLKADPVGFVEMLERAQRVQDGTAETIPASDLFD